MIKAYCARNPSRILGKSLRIGSEDTYIQVLYKQYRLTLLCCEILDGKEHQKNKPICYKGTDVVLICFSLASLKSFIHVINKWYPETNQYCPNGTKFVVATMSDLRRNDQIKHYSNIDNDIITRELGDNLTRYFNADGYFECSSVSGEGLNDLFHQLIDFVLQKREQKRHGKLCTIL
ncbi:uncharacterized protein TRIADDRAFT_19854 [Trichoplax adhaerens]|uniref:Uncharacterized protein n=1 Tax=Trichoplax adhaerens TaxID=10228 RepID=B3RK41_TRIAD|nr:hypothetical protein TRIADDRAFT_19854 [Trichoplax adhaerens]EDV29373.1 hypothetical protein TRIADDRAFT_19854 [Trichoplax adhaerens]|eukprot:XP_002108575.1 hypothetical protein TRIADDRAFT_19854 [Trichoplax adhaerens]